MANSSILVRNKSTGGAWSEPQSSAYTNEAHLQQLLLEDPQRVPGVGEGAAAVRELQTSAGPIDLCVVEPSGSITVVECKLSSNSEKRRMVVGQVLDYASALRLDGMEAFRQGWAQKEGPSLDDLLDPGSVTLLEDNISTGRINLCLAVDRIDPDLRRLIEYLNLLSRNEVAVTALELTYAQHGDVEILIPSTYGMELVDRSSPKQRWTWETFLDALVDDDDRRFARAINERAESVPPLGPYKRLWMGSKPGGGIFVHPTKQRYSPFRMHCNASGRLRIFGNWRSWGPLMNDERFSEIARLLGQSHLSTSKGVGVEELDLEEFWSVALECDRAIHNAPGE